jgi:hypothetical protein
MNRIAIDFVGPLTTTKKNNSYLLTVICPFSRWPQAFPVSRNTALKTIECLKKSISVYGTPSEVLSDRGFISSELAEFLNSVGIKQIATAPYTASTNGTVEGFHRYLAQQLSMRVNGKHSNWDEPEVLDAALFAYRTAPIDGMRVTPFQMMFGREPNMPIDNVLADEADQESEQGSKRRRLMTPEEYCDLAREKAQEVHEEVRKLQSERFARNQRQDEKARPIPIYEEGQKLFLKYPKGTFRKPGCTTKFSQVNNGPYTITRAIKTTSGATVYEVEHDTTKYRCKVGHRRIIPFEQWNLPDGASRPRLLPGEWTGYKRDKKSQDQLVEARPMNIGQANAAGDDTVNVDRVPDQTSKVIRAREAGNGTDSDNADPVQASELKPISTGVADAVENGNSRADEGRDISKRTAPEEAGRRILRAKPKARGAENEYAKHFATTAAQREGRKPRRCNFLGYCLRRFGHIKRADTTMVEIWNKFCHP